MRHRRGTPGLTPYRLRTIEAGNPRRRRPARHLRRNARGPASRDTGSAVARRVAGVLTRRTARRTAGSQVALGVAAAITLALLVIGGYQAATGAAVVLGMF
jgi:hypothetical protein